MKIVCLESLAVEDSYMDEFKKKLEDLGHSFEYYEKSNTPELQLERSKDADIVILANTPLDTSVIENNPNLKYIDVAFTGVDHIPMELAKSKGIKISNAKGYATTPVAELCLGFMIDLLRNIPDCDKATRNLQTKAGLVGNTLKGKTVGIIGCGAIGKKVADFAKVFGANVLAFNRSKVDHPSIDEQTDLEDLLKRSDIVSVHTPLTPSTKDLISEKELSLMKPTAYLINTARGPVVNEEALAKALNDEVIAGAAIDVFDEEPPLKSSHPILMAQNVILTPHIGFATKESMKDRADIVFDNCLSYLDGTIKNEM